MGHTEAQEFVEKHPTRRLSHPCCACFTVRNAAFQRTKCRTSQCEMPCFKSQHAAYQPVKRHLSQYETAPAATITLIFIAQKCGKRRNRLRQRHLPLHTFFRRICGYHAFVLKYRSMAGLREIIVKGKRYKSCHRAFRRLPVVEYNGQRHTQYVYSIHIFLPHSPAYFSKEKIIFAHR